MSRQAIAAVLARTDLASGERLVALSLASFAGRENRAWPGAPAASARAGLSRSRYQQVREKLVTRGLVGCRRARHRPWSSEHGHPPVRRHRSVVGRRHQRRALRGGAGLQPGPRTRAAATGDDGRGGGRAKEPCATSPPTSCALAAGIADRTYRRARDCAAGVWLSSSWSTASEAAGTRTYGCVRDPRELGDAVASRVPRRVAPPAGARPLVGVGRLARRCGPGSGIGDTNWQKGRSGSDTYRRETVLILTGVSGSKGGHDRTVWPEKCPVVTGVSVPKGGQDQTLFELALLESPAETPAKTPAETPAPNARAGKGTPEPQNQGTPPQPP